MSTVIETRSVARHFGAGETLVKAIDNVSISIAEKEFTAIIGPSGSGKSTLLQMMGALDSPTHGQVLLNDEDISGFSSKQLSNFRLNNIGFVFQAYNLIPVLSAKENIEYVMLLQGVDELERHQRVEQILKELDLQGRANRRPAELSGGQQQRVAVARAMVSRPKLILADEPTANLDSKTGYALLDMMKQLNEEQGMTFLFSTHDTKIMEYATRIIKLVDGQVVEDLRK